MSLNICPALLETFTKITFSQVAVFYLAETGTKKSQLTPVYPKPKEILFGSDVTKYVSKKNTTPYCQI